MNNPIPIYETTVLNGVAEETLIGHRPAPRPPRDTRALVKALMFRLAVGFTVLAMGLSVAAIGALFSTFVPPYVAYSVAAVFDGLWIYALLGEWMSQTHPKARLACQLAGVFFMLVSMAAIILAAIQLHMVAAGIIASLVPLGVKAAWWLRLETTTHRLPVAYQIRLERERDKVHTALAMEIESRELAQVRRQTARIERQAVTELLAMEAESGIAEHLLVTREAPQGVPTGPSPTVRSAVRAAVATTPDASVQDIVEQLARVGVDVTEDTVRTVLEADDAPDAHHDALHVSAASEIAKSTAIRDAASALGGDARAAQIVDFVRDRHHLEVEPNYVRAVLSRESKRTGGYL